MTPIDFEGTNIELQSPAEMREGDCKPLKAWQGIGADGYPGFITAWVPSEGDLAALNAGRPLYLKILGSAFPPVAFFTFDEEGNPLV